MNGMLSTESPVVTPDDTFPPPPRPGEPGWAPPLGPLTAEPATVPPTVQPPAQGTPPTDVPRSEPRPHRKPRHLARWIVLGSVFVLLAATVVLVVLPARRDDQKYDDGHAAYLAGDCVTAVAEFDSLIDSWRLLDLSGRVGDAKAQRAECQRLLDLDALAATDAPAALAGYVAFADQQATSPLRPIALARATALVDTAGAAGVASPATCDLLGTLATADVLTGNQTTAMRGACITAYDAVGDTTAALDQAELVLREDGVSAAADIAVDYLTSRVVGCERLADLGDVPAASPVERFRCVDVLDAAGRTDEAIATAVAVVEEAGSSTLGRDAVDYLTGSVAGCTALSDLPGTTAAVDDDARAACLATLADAGEDDEAYALAVGVLRSAGAPGTDRAIEIVLAAPQACSSIDMLLDLPGIEGRTDATKALLDRCIDEATAAGDEEAAAGLRIDFVVRLPFDPEASTQRAEFLAGEAGCAMLDRVLATPALSGDSAFVADYSFHCGQVAEYRADWTGAQQFYETFLFVAPGDGRADAARAGLARALIEQAEASGAGELPEPTPSGSSGSGAAEVTIYNMSPRELRVVVSGPDSRIEVIPACADCEEYSIIGPLFCRTDVPSLTISLTGGDYKVLAEATSGGITPFVGTWNLEAGDRYESCFYIVTTFG